MAVLHPFNLASSLDAKSLPVAFRFSSYDLEVNRTLRLSWRQRFSPLFKILPFVVLTLVSLWFINAGFSSLQPLLVETEFLQAVTPTATLALLLNRFWSTLCKATVLPWSELRMVEGTLRKRMDIEHDTGVSIVHYYCMIGGETLPLTEAQFFALQVDVPYRAYVAYPLLHIVSIEPLA